MFNFIILEIKQIYTNIYTYKSFFLKWFNYIIEYNSNFFFLKKKTKLPKFNKKKYNVKTTDCFSIITNSKLFTISKKKIRKKKFYRIVKLRTRYKNLKKITYVKYSTYSWISFYKANYSVKGMFHVRLIFNLAEFFIYDLINYYKHLNMPIHRSDRTNYDASFNRWKKNNFFYDIRKSVDTIRAHTAMLFNVKWRNHTQANIFFNSLRHINTFSYLWFLEFNVMMFLVKIKLSSSIHQSMALVYSNGIFRHHQPITHKWDFIHVNDLIQVVIGIYSLFKLKLNILQVFSSFKKLRKYIKQRYLRLKRSKSRKKVPSDVLLKQAYRLYLSKTNLLKYIEADYRSLTFILLPTKNPIYYLQYISNTWVNVWNHRIVTWKYLT